MWPFLMPLFLFLSGYFASAALARPWAAVLRPRVGRFLYLYLLWSLIHAAAMWAFPTSRRSYRGVSPRSWRG
ncbi:acyltransferase family protein [Microbacterium sp. NRRL B-14842]|uniref:acyltransferase family protein n=1 Tax=Microbacterium sp. NRRL B-14842 TaxID=3162881 RepID=UPI003D2835B4